MIHSVSRVKDLTFVIIPFLQKYPLLTQKRTDFLLFNFVLDIINNKQHLTTEGLLKVISIRASMNRGLTKELSNYFSNIIPVERAKISLTEIKDPYWLSGFTDGEGCFKVIIYKSTSTSLGQAVRLRFRLYQHFRDTILIYKLIEYLDCGSLSLDPRSPAVEFIVSRFLDINDKITPFFAKYLLLGIKNKDYLDLVKVVQLMESKAHLTEQGLNQIRKIKAGMNTLRC